MEIAELASTLRGMYQSAPEKEKAVQIHLFGIIYAEELANVSLSDVLEISGLPRSYVTEVNKGRNLSKYVELKQQWPE